MTDWSTLRRTSEPRQPMRILFETDTQSVAPMALMAYTVVLPETGL